MQTFQQSCFAKCDDLGCLLGGGVNSVPELFYCSTCIARVTALPVIGYTVHSFCCKRGSVDRVMAASRN
jgi:hypothetical protein